MYCSAMVRLHHDMFSKFHISLFNQKLPSVLWHCWLGSRKGIRPAKTEWWGTGVCGYLPGARCKWFAYGPADVSAIPSSLAPV